MALTTQCACGATVTAEDEEGFLAAVGQHVETTHPDLAGTMTREQILGMAERT